MNKEELLAYIYAFLSYLFRGRTLRIERVILFGSVARGEFDQKSDIDLFIDVERKNEKQMEKIAERALGRFYALEEEKWRLKGIQNKFSLKVGDLDDWRLKDSVERDGIFLYSSAQSTKLKKYMLFTLEPITPLKKRIKVIRKLFGRKELGYNEVGLVSKYNGVILDPRTFLVSSDGLKETTTFLAGEKTKYRFEEIWK